MRALGLDPWTTFLSCFCFLCLTPFLFISRLQLPSACGWASNLFLSQSYTQSCIALGLLTVALGGLTGILHLLGLKPSVSLDILALSSMCLPTPAFPLSVECTAICQAAQTKTNKSQTNKKTQSFQPISLLTPCPSGSPVGFFSQIYPFSPYPLLPPNSSTTVTSLTYPNTSVSHSVVSDSLWPLQAPLCVEFSRQEYWSGLPFPSPGDLGNSGIEPRTPALQADTLLPESPAKSEPQEASNWPSCFHLHPISTHSFSTCLR